MNAKEFKIKCLDLVWANSQHKISGHDQIQVLIFIYFLKLSKKFLSSDYFQNQKPKYQLFNHVASSHLSSWNDLKCILIN